MDNIKNYTDMNDILKQYQCTEEFLIENRCKYDSWICLKTQKNLSPYFCFNYLYDKQEYDSADNWTDYNDIYRYLKLNNYTDKEIEEEFNKN